MARILIEDTSENKMKLSVEGTNEQLANLIANVINIDNNMLLVFTLAVMSVMEMEKKNSDKINLN